jgi:hypothetical protein
MRARLAVPAVVAFLLLGMPGAAHASCAEPPTDSPYAFTGTVLSVNADGRLAHVRRDDGNRVDVHGGPTLRDDVGTSVDRHFAAGGRYEFHPRNASSPFQDDACTATRQLSGPSPAPVEPHDDRLPDWLPIDEQAGPSGYAIGVAAGLLVLAAVTAAFAFMSRRSSGGRAKRRLSSAERTSSTSV